MTESNSRRALGLVTGHKMPFAVVEFDHRIGTQGNFPQEDDNPVVNGVLCEDGVGGDQSGKGDYSRGVICPTPQAEVIVPAAG